MAAIDNSPRGAHRTAVGTGPSPSTYLLLAGQHGTSGGLRDFVALFHDEAAARRAFTDIRLSTNHRAAWAELGRVERNGKLSMLCWFGRDRPAPGISPTDPTRDHGPRPTFWRRRRAAR